MWLIFEASFKTREKRIGRAAVTLQRGELAASVRFLQKAWHWASTRRVHAFLCALQNRNMVRNTAGTDFTVISLCNYDKYQSGGTLAEHLAERETERSRNAGGTNENKDEIRVEERGAYAPLARQGRFAEFWDTYPHRNGTKKAKAKASESYARAIRRGVSEQVIIDGARAAHRHPDVIRGYARDPTSWLNQEGWTDEISQIVTLEPRHDGRQPSRIEADVTAFVAGASRIPR
jgi:hypothetical protein